MSRELGSTTNTSISHRGAPASAEPPWKRASPGRLLAATLACIFVVELVTLWAIQGRQPWEASAGVLLDAAALVAGVVPVMYLLLYLPMARHIRERAGAEAALRAARRDLEDRVESRTAELEASNRRLKKEGEERLRADERSRFQSDLLDNVEQAVVATDLVGRILYWNRSSERLYGWTAGEVRGRTLSELFPGTPAYGSTQPACLRLKPGEEWRGEVDLRRKGGEPFTAHLTCFPVLDLDRHPKGIVHLSTDVTGRRDVASELEYSERKYSTLVENSPTGIYIIRDGKVVFANTKLQEITGCSRDELLGADWARFVHEDDRGFLKEIEARISGGEATPGQSRARVVTKEGAVRWVDVRWTPIEYRGALSIIGSVQDVTAVKEAEGALRRSEEALRRLSAQLLTAQEDERRRVARDLHDGVGQSLSAIKFAIERAVSEHDGGGAQEISKALKTVIPSILQDGMEEVRRISMALRPSILDDLGLLATLRWWCRELQEAHPGLKVEVRLGVEEGDIADPLKIVMFRISQEATNNAVKHSRATKITVGVQRSDEGLALTVEDDGVGFDPEDVGRPGLSGGLGLSAMEERAELSGGRFFLVSSAGRGTTVRVVWPVSG